MLILGFIVVLVVCSGPASVSARTHRVKNKRQLHRRYHERVAECETSWASASASSASASVSTDPMEDTPDSGDHQQQQEPGGGGCAHLILEESAGCVHRCVSPDCHAQLYGGDGNNGGGPLELGEIDPVRHAQFELCAKRELKEKARMERIEKRRKYYSQQQK